MWFRSQTNFNREAKGNFKMAYYEKHFLHLIKVKLLLIWWVFYFSALFTGVLSENSPFFSLAWPFATGLKILRHFLIQSEVKPEPVATRSYTFSRALYEPRVFVSSFHQFTGLSLSFVVSRKKKSIFGSRALDWKSLYLMLLWSGKHGSSHESCVFLV